MSANFSVLFDQSSGLVQWSPNGETIASAVCQTLVVRKANGLEIVEGGLRPCPDKIEGLEWGPDSDLVLCSFYKRSLVEVFSLSKPEWRCRIREGMAGMVRAQWAPDGRHVITFSEFGLHMSVWSLSTRQATLPGKWSQELLNSLSKFPVLVYFFSHNGYRPHSCTSTFHSIQSNLPTHLYSLQMHTVRHPKTAPGCLAFTPDSRIMAVATRRDSRDVVRLFDTATWAPMGDFAADTLDLSSLHWSPDGRVLCILDNCLQYRVLFYSLTGELVGRLEAYANALGGRSMSWSPNGTLLAVGSYDQCVRLVSRVSWKPVAVLRHVRPKAQPLADRVAYYEEVPVDENGNMIEKGIDRQADRDIRPPLSHRPGAGVAKGMGSRAGDRKRAPSGVPKHRTSSKNVEITYIPRLRGGIPSERPDPSKANPRLGVGQILSWSYDSRFLATRNDNMPSTLWVWDAEELELYSIVVQMDAVRSVKWCPTRNSLAMCTGNHHVYLWNSEGASWINVPNAGLDIMGFRWSPSGHALLLLSKNKVCCCYLVERNLELAREEEEEVGALDGDKLEGQGRGHGHGHGRLFVDGDSSVEEGEAEGEEQDPVVRRLAAVGRH